MGESNDSAIVIKHSFIPFGAGLGPTGVSMPKGSDLTSFGLRSIAVARTRLSQEWDLGKKRSNLESLSASHHESLPRISTAFAPFPVGSQALRFETGSHQVTGISMEGNSEKRRTTRGSS